MAAGLLLLLGILSAGLCPGAVATEHYSPLSLLKQELQHRQQQEAPAGGGCSPQSGDWGDQYSVECGGEWAAAGGRASRSPGAAGAAGPWAEVLGRPGLTAGSRGAACAPAGAASRRSHPCRCAPSSRSRRGEGGEWRKELTTCYCGQGRLSGVLATVERVEEKMASGPEQPPYPLRAPRVPGERGRDRRTKEDRVRRGDPWPVLGPEIRFSDLLG